MELWPQVRLRYAIGMVFTLIAIIIGIVVINSDNETPASPPVNDVDEVTSLLNDQLVERSQTIVTETNAQDVITTQLQSAESSYTAGEYDPEDELSIVLRLAFDANEIDDSQKAQVYARRALVLFRQQDSSVQQFYATTISNLEEIANE